MTSSDGAAKLVLSARHDPLVPPLVRGTDCVLVALIAVVLVPMCLMYAGPAYMNADTPLLTVMSLQRLTLFIWGQNRLINLVPLLARPVPWPDTNLAVQIFLFGAGFIGLVALFGCIMARLVLRSERRLDAWLCFVTLLFTFFAIASRYAVHVFVTEGQPYGLSGLLMGGGLVAVLRPARLSALTITAAAVAMWLGGGLNPSLVLLTGAVCAIAFIFWREVRSQAILAFVLSVLACGSWLLIGMRFPGPSYGEFALIDVWANLNGAWRSLGLGFARGPLLAGVSLSTAAALFIATRPLFGVRPRWLLIVLCAGVALVWFGLFAENAWVAANGWHFRYFYPVTFAAMLVLTAPIMVLLIGCRTSVRAAALVLLLAACPGLLVAPWRSLDSFPIFDHVVRFVAEAQRLDVSLVAGSYWSVYPTVFILDRHGFAFGIEEDRAPSNRANILREIGRIESHGERARSLCVDAAVGRCLEQAKSITGRVWRVAAESCDADCTLIEIADAPR